MTRKCTQDFTLRHAFWRSAWRHIIFDDHVEPRRPPWGRRGCRDGRGIVGHKRSVIGGTSGGRETKGAGGSGVRYGRHDRSRSVHLFHEQKKVEEEAVDD